MASAIAIARTREGREGEWDQTLAQLQQAVTAIQERLARLEMRASLAGAA